MRRTILDTPVLIQFLRPIAHLVMKLVGWRVVGGPPAEKKFILIAAPHTSNWDGVLLLMAAGILRVKLFWLGKDSLFPPVLGSVMRWLGGIPVNRREPGDLVARTAELLRREDELIIVVPPEGTRSRSNRWKTGFYYMALQGEVPIGLGFLDYSTRTAGIGPMFEPSGSIESDLPRIQDFYKNMTGKNNRDFGEITINQEDDRRTG